MPYALDVTNLQVKYKNITALHDIHLHVPRGVRAAIVGPNGAGKSTLIKSVLGLVPATFEKCLLLEQPLSNVHQALSYVPQSAEVNWDFPTTVYDVLLMPLLLHHPPFKKIPPRIHQQVQEALALLNLTDLQHRHIRELSGGQKQRVFIARAIAQQADLLFLDEPLASVDVQSEEIIMSQLRHLQQQGKTTITVHHDLNTVPEYFDYIIFINKTVVAAGPVETTFTPELIQKTYQSVVR